MDAAYIVNPASGRGRGKRVAEALPLLLSARGITGRIHLTSCPGEATDLAARAAEECAVVAAVGGDGTAHEVVNGIAGTRASFALLPVGSGNDLARALEVPSELGAALDVIARGRTSRIDLGRFEGRWFANSLGLGFEAQVTIESRKIRRLRGFAIYLWAVAKALRRLHCPYLVIRADAASFEGRRLLVCVGNGARVGGGFLLTPDARPDDGLLDVCIVDAMGPLDILRLLPRSLDGTHVTNPAVTMLRTRTLSISSSDGFPFHADGEVVDVRRHHLAIELAPAALPVIH